MRLSTGLQVAALYAAFIAAVHYSATARLCQSPKTLKSHDCDDRSRRQQQRKSRAEPIAFMHGRSHSRSCPSASFPSPSIAGPAYSSDTNRRALHDFVFSEDDGGLASLPGLGLGADSGPAGGLAPLPLGVRHCGSGSGDGDGELVPFEDYMSFGGASFSDY
jgi:hypothetical protein